MSWLAEHLHTVKNTLTLGMSGSVSAVVGLTIEAIDLPVPVGSSTVIVRDGRPAGRAEVVGFQGDRTLLMPLSGCQNVSRGDRIDLAASSPTVSCSAGLLGRVIDGMGRPVDEKGDLPPGVPVRLDAPSIRPMGRENIRKPLYTGVRAIDALHTCGRGQRMGIFAGPGVGKSTLISAIARNTSADVSVVALIGERGREVQEFIAHALDEQSLKRCVLVVCTGDEPPLMKVRAAKVACAVSEYFRDQGKHVLLMMDSVTRLAQAQRQIGLAAKEPPATKGFPPSVFALMPQILERAGNVPHGSVTGFYTVLVEGDDFNEPIPDAIKGISDGHILLTRELANLGHYPAIDMLQSISRVRGDVAPREQVDRARKVLGQIASYKKIEDLVNIGAYVEGGNADYDTAYKLIQPVNEFLKQDLRTPSTPEAWAKQLADLCTLIDTTRRQFESKRGTQPRRA